MGMIIVLTSKNFYDLNKINWIKNLSQCFVHRFNISFYFIWVWITQKVFWRIYQCKPVSIFLSFSSCFPPAPEVTLDLFLQKMELWGTEFTLEYTFIGTFSNHRDRAGLNCILQRMGHMWAIQEAVFYGEIKTKADK